MSTPLCNATAQMASEGQCCVVKYVTQKQQNEITHLQAQVAQLTQIIGSATIREAEKDSKIEALKSMCEEYDRKLQNEIDVTSSKMKEMDIEKEKQMISPCFVVVGENHIQRLAKMNVINDTYGGYGYIGRWAYKNNMSIEECCEQVREYQKRYNQIKLHILVMAGEKDIQSVQTEGLSLNDIPNKIIEPFQNLKRDLAPVIESITWCSLIESKEKPWNEKINTEMKKVLINTGIEILDLDLIRIRTGQGKDTQKDYELLNKRLSRFIFDKLNLSSEVREKIHDTARHLQEQQSLKAQLKLEVQQRKGAAEGQRETDHSSINQKDRQRAQSQDRKSRRDYDQRAEPSHSGRPIRGRPNFRREPREQTRGYFTGPSRPNRERSRSRSEGRRQTKRVHWQ